MRKKKEWNAREQLIGLVEGDNYLRQIYYSLGYDPKREKQVDEILEHIKSILERKSTPLPPEAEMEMKDWLEKLTDVFGEHAPQGPKVRKSVLQQISDFPSELAGGRQGKALERLTEKVQSAVVRECSDDWKLNEQKKILDEHLESLLIARYWFRRILYPHLRRLYEERDGVMDMRWWYWNLRPTVLEEAQRFLGQEWMHRPSVKNVLLFVLLQCELVRFTGAWEQAESSMPWFTNIQKAFGALSAASGFAYFERYIPSGLVGLASLFFLWDRIRVSRLRKACGLIEEAVEDVAIGQYDNEELARRLRDLEAKGLFVNTLIYSVLKSCPATPALTAL